MEQFKDETEKALIEKAREDAQDKFSRLGDLGMTAEDMKAYGGSVTDERMINNPDKTKGELISDEEISNYIYEKQTVIDKYLNSDNDTYKMMAKAYKEKLDNTKNYLKSIGRLSE